MLKRKEARVGKVRTQRDRLAIERQLIEAKKLASLAASHPVMRFQFEDEVQTLTRLLEEFDGRREARASVVFHGRPVVGSRAIDAKFSLEVLTPFLEAVKTEYVLQTRGKIGGRGPRAGESVAKLMIAGTRRGSFGFDLVAPEVDQDLLAESEVADALKTVASELERASHSDDSYSELLEDVNERVYGNLKEFFRILKTHEAGFELESNDAHVEVSVEQASDTYNRFDHSSISSDAVIVDGTFRGAMLDSWQFNFKGQDEDYRGRLDEALTEEVVSDMVKTKLNQACKAEMRVITTRNPKGMERKRFILLALK